MPLNLGELDPTWYDYVFLGYFMAVDFFYLFLFVLGTINVYFRRKELRVEDLSQTVRSNALPEISFIVPMYNESKNIMNALLSILNLTYRYKQLIAVNDGSTDDTLDVLKKELDLVEIPKFYEEKLKTASVRAVFRSRKHPEVIVIDKEHSLRGDTVNAGVNACKDPYFIVIDADTVVDNRGFEALIRPLFADPTLTAIGAGVRVKDGCTLEFNLISTQEFPHNFISAFQNFEYLRSFLMRQGWNYFGGNFVIAGAFSIFPTEIFKQIGGLISCAAEDMEVIVRLHRYMTDRNIPYKILYLPDPIAWTNTPQTLKKLKSQRIRWHFGLLESIWSHKKMCMNPKYKSFGTVVYPFFVWGEALEPVMETLGYGVIFFAWFSGHADKAFILLLFLVTIGFTFAFSVLCLLVEEMSFRKYTSVRSVFLIFLLTLVENFGYRQLTIYWRLIAFGRFFKEFVQVKKTAKTAKQLIRADSNPGK